MTFKVGDTVLWINADINPNKSTIKSGSIEKIINKHEIKILGERYPMNSTFCYPDSQDAWMFLKTGILLAQRHKEEQNEYIKLTDKFNNDLIRKGLK